MDQSVSNQHQDLVATLKKIFKSFLVFQIIDIHTYDFFFPAAADLFCAASDTKVAACDSEN